MNFNVIDSFWVGDMATRCDFLSCELGLFCLMMSKITFSGEADGMIT